MKQRKIIANLFLLFFIVQGQKLPAQFRPFQDTLIICQGDTVELEGWVKQVQCPCTQGPCSPFIQPGGSWESPTEVICTDCIYTEVSPDATTLYRHTTPDFICPNPPPGPGPAPPAGPTYFGAVVETLVIVKDCPTPCASNRGTFFFEDCDDGTPFFFLRLADGRVLDPYFAEGIDFEVKAGQKVNFDYTPANFSTPCSIAEQSVILTCVEGEDTPATPTEHCVCNVCGVSDPLTLPWVQAELDLPGAIGMEVYWNLASKQVVLASIINFPDAGSFIYDCSGNRICFVGGIGGPQIHNCPFDPERLELIGTFRKEGDTPLCGSDGSTYTSYCAAECSGVSIINEGECVSPQKNLFSDYPWLNGLVDTFNCEGTVISEYDLGPYAYIYMESPQSEVLFFEDGTYYCFNSIGYDCLSLYGLSEEQVTARYVCKGSDFGDYPWLSEVIKVGDCCENSQAIEYQNGVYNFIYVSSNTICKDGLGTLYFQDGTYYCSDVSGYDCRSIYQLNLVEGKVIWECNNTGNSLKQLAGARIAIKPAQAQQLVFFPNPVRQKLNVEIEEGIAGRLRLYDVQGRILEDRKLESTSFNQLGLDFSTYEKGIYLLEWNSDGQSVVHKIFKQ